MSSDPSLLELFHAEAETHMGVLTAGILELERDPRQATRYEELMRAAHSIKGAARIVGIDRAVALAHVIEDCFVAARQGQIALTSDTVDVLLPAVDLLQAVTQAHLGTAQPSDAQIEQVVQQVRAAMLGTPSPRVAITPSPQQKVPTASPPSQSPPTPNPPLPLAPPAANLTPPRDFTVPAVLDASWVESQRAALAACFAERVSEIRLNLSHTTTVDPLGAALLALLSHKSREPAAVSHVRVTDAAPALAALLAAVQLTPSQRTTGEGG